jgi:hypothetical protein
MVDLVGIPERVATAWSIKVGHIVSTMEDAGHVGSVVVIPAPFNRREALLIRHCPLHGGPVLLPNRETRLSNTVLIPIIASIVTTKASEGMRLERVQSRGHILKESLTRLHHVTGTFMATDGTTSDVASNSTGQGADELFLQLATDQRAANSADE